MNLHKISDPMISLSCLPPMFRCKRSPLSDVSKKSKDMITPDLQTRISRAKKNSEIQNFVMFGLLEKRNSEVQVELEFNGPNGAETSLELCKDEQSSLVLVARGQPDPSCVATALASAPHVERAIVHDCGFTDDMALQTGQALARGCRLLSALTLSQNRITPVGIRHLSAGLMIHAALHTLDLSGNSCGDHGSESLAVLVCSSPALRVLNLKSNSIGPTGAAVLAAALVPFAQAEDSDCCSVGSPSSRRCGVALEELDLSRNRIGDAGARSFAAAIGERSCALRALDLSCNIITSRGARRLAAALSTNRALESLRVVSIALGGEEETALKALERSCAVIAL